MVRKPPPIGTIATIGIALGLGLKFPCYTAVISGSDRRRIENPWCIALFIRFSTSCYLLITLVLLHWLKGRPSYKTTDCSISVISLLYLYYISLGWRIRTDTRCWVYGYWWWSWVRRKNGLMWRIRTDTDWVHCWCWVERVESEKEWFYEKCTAVVTAVCVPTSRSIIGRTV